MPFVQYFPSGYKLHMVTYENGSSIKHIGAFMDNANKQPTQEICFTEAVAA